MSIPTPIGRCVAAVSSRGLAALGFAGGWKDLRRALERRFPGARFRREREVFGFRSRIEAYFGGDLVALDGLRLDPGGTPFFRNVWQALRAVRPGSTITYQELARRAGRPRAARAAGAANARNPVALVIPCHRVIGSDGSLTGYGYGLARKRWLLDHEARHAGPQAGA